MEIVHCRTGGLQPLLIAIVVTLGVTVAAPLNSSHEAPWLLSWTIARAEASVGSGPPFFAPTDLAVETSGALVVVDAHLAAVLRVDPVSGDRAIVADPGTGSGFGFGLGAFPTSIAVEASGTFVVMGTCCGFELFSSYMLRVDPVSGDRTTVSGLGIGSGPPFAVPSDVAVEASGALVVVDTGPQVLRVDPVSGDRTVISSPEIGNGPALVGPLGIAVEASGALVVVDRGLQAVLRVDPVSGDRTGVSHATIGSGPVFVSPTAVAVEASGALVVLDVGLEAVVRVDPVSGDRTGVSHATIGSGPTFSLPVGIAVEASGALVVVDTGLGAVVRVDPVSGDRTVVSR
jgi:streptogramin lyase